MRGKKEIHSVRESLREFVALLVYFGKKKRFVYLLTVVYFSIFILAGVLQVYLPKVVLAELEQKVSIRHFVIVLSIVSIGLLTSIFFRDKFKVRFENISMVVHREMQMDYIHKLLYTEYVNLENKEFLDKRNQAKAALFEGSVGEEDISGELLDFLPKWNTVLARLGSVILYGILISSLSSFLTLLIGVTMVINAFLFMQSGKRNYEYQEGAFAAWRKAKYVTDRAGDFTLAKDVRLYHMDNWLVTLINEYTGLRLHYKGLSLRNNALEEIASSIVMGIQTLGIYIYLIYQVLHGQMLASDMVLYAGMAGKLTQEFFELVQDLMQIYKMSNAFGKVQCFLTYGRNSEEKTLPIRKGKVRIQLEHVSFRFPNMGENLLDDLNVTIAEGEKLAVVGVNGAGKTTLMKLICGLLTPTAGRILLNGQDMAKLPPDERYVWFSSAFQDITFLPLSIRENISMCSKESTDDNRVLNCLKLAGMDKKVMSVAGGLDALLEKNINENAVDFSGGERQRLVLARALYRDAPVLILDEPTAALDPLAENEMYQKYAEFANGKTSFFVSHRLSSTSFCDRILLLDGGKIAETGTHEELLRKGGLYAKMFELQSYYYNTENKEVLE